MEESETGYEKLQLYSETRKKLDELYNDTIQCFMDIHSDSLLKDRSNIFMSDMEKNDIRDVIIGVPTLYFVGQVNCGKSSVINELLGKTVCPASQTPSLHRPVKLQYGSIPFVRLLNKASKEIAGTYKRLEKAIPREYLESDSDLSAEYPNEMVEASINHPLMKQGLQIIERPRLGTGDSKIIAFLIYVFDANYCITEEDTVSLLYYQENMPDTPIFFLVNKCDIDEEAAALDADSDSEERKPRISENATHSSNRERTMFDKLKEMGFLQNCSDPEKCDNYFTISARQSKSARRNRETNFFTEQFDKFRKVLINFIQFNLQEELKEAVRRINTIHTRSLDFFITHAFKLARDLQATPKRISYVRAEENKLYNNLLEMVHDNQQEMSGIIEQSIAEITPDILGEAESFEFERVRLSESGRLADIRQVRRCNDQLEKLVLEKLNVLVSKKIVQSASCLQESMIGTLSRCLARLEEEQEDTNNGQARQALTRVVASAYGLDFRVANQFSSVQAIWESLKMMFQTGFPQPVPDSEWKRNTAQNILGKIQAVPMARGITTQFTERLNESHSIFETSMDQLLKLHQARLGQTEEDRHRTRTEYAPRLARLALYSTSLCDQLEYGIPIQGREIGRGHFGVVYSCIKWAGKGPLALKSVVPPDDKHWGSLALEFYYARNIPAHKNICGFHGAVLDESVNGHTIAYLIMDRLSRDLFAALKSKSLDPRTRFNVSLDIVEGARYLHNQGLVHRDLKLQNVLLDSNNMAKITDYGFCKPEAMMSGSLVGTPIYIAPELFSGLYDKTVDIYAFGIIFWYLCSGRAERPKNFNCRTFPELQDFVERGGRPERLVEFDDDMWNLMSRCWHVDPSQRPLFGDISLEIKHIMALTFNIEESFEIISSNILSL
ncbi:dual serine/threonine and tyrosine protein kinase-like [Bolinopsis microptera]|uniref:dual serine/threonine and tyrosine protein kinase-like n=1 Tax=Bolinopsis microptera TaxID=2820187 RepID=UPI00307ADEA6